MPVAYSAMTADPPIEIMVACGHCGGSGLEGEYFTWNSEGPMGDGEYRYSDDECEECCGSGWQLLPVRELEEL